MGRRGVILVSLSLCIISSHALADVVWPALLLETRMLTWWAIGLGLLIEFLVVRWLFALTLQRAAIATLVANAASTVLGVLLLPIAGFAWEFFPGSIYMLLLHWGTFNPITWAATFLLACLVNTVVEAFIYKHVFTLRVRWREFFWVCVANALSIAVAFASLFAAPPEL
jgi:hypothetical protein